MEEKEIKIQKALGLYEKCPECGCTYPLKDFTESGGWCRHCIRDLNEKCERIIHE